MSFIKLTFLATLTAIAGLSYSQLPGGGGGVDSNPYNPLNWNCEYEVSYDGNTTFSGVKETSPGIFQNYTKVYQWGNPVGPYDDAAYNEAPNSNRIEATASGTISKRIKWIGVGNPPPKAYVRVSATVSVQSGTLQLAADCDNGLRNAALATGNPTIDPGLVSAGVQIREILINENTGISEEIKIHQSAHVQVQTVMGSAHVYIPNMELSIEARFLQIKNFSLEPNYISGEFGIQTPTINNDLTKKRLYVGLQYSAFNDNFYVPSAYFGIYHGMWPFWSSLQPNQPWWYAWSDPMAILDHQISYPMSTVLNMVNSGPITVSIPDFIVIDSGITSMATMELSVHAPLDNFITVENRKLKVGDWLLASSVNDVIWYPNSSNEYPIAMTQSTVDSVTRQVQTTLSGESGINFEFFKAGIGISNTETLGQTAQISTTIPTTITVNAIQDTPMFAWWIRRKLYLESKGTCSRWAQNGFQESVDWTVTDWLSGSKEAASASDYQNRFHFESHFIVPSNEFDQGVPPQQ